MQQQVQLPLESRQQACIMAVKTQAPMLSIQAAMHRSRFLRHLALKPAGILLVSQEVSLTL